VERCFAYVHGWVVSHSIDAHRSVALSGTLVFHEIEGITTVFQPGEDLFPTDEHGKAESDTLDFCATWEVSEYLKRGQQRKTE
jgi:hypothetical protein